MPDTDPTPTAPGGGLVPAPLSIDGPYRSAVRLGEETALAAAPGTEDTARWLRTTLGAAFGLPLPPGSDGATDTLAAHPRPGPPRGGLPPGGRHRLGCTDHRRQPGRRLLGRADAAAAPRPARLPPGAARPRARGRPAAADHRGRPRFGWRGMLLDVARHFLPKDGVLRYLDLLAAHKLNVLHLHLTDDQGWRIEIARYPRADRDRRAGGSAPSSVTGPPPSGTSARTAATTPRTTSARSSPTPPSGISPSSPRSTSPDTRRPPSPRIRNSATPTSSTPPR